MARISRNEQTMFESAVDPKRRPSVDMLLSKMRKLSSLQDKPEAVLLVVDDMLHHYFMEEAKRPAHLWQIMQSAMYKFQLVTGSQNLREADLTMVAVENSLEIFGLMDGPPAERPEGGYPGRHSTFGSKLPEGLPPLPSELVPFASGGHSQEVVETVEGDSPDWTPYQLGTAIHQVLENKEQKEGVASIIMNHVYRYAGNQCNCGRPYPTHKEWAKHLRIRIWRYLENEFSPEETTQEAGTTSSSQPAQVE